MGDAEFYSVWQRPIGAKYEYPAKTWKNWKLLLINQFHDILPSSSIRMYEDSAVQYEEIIQSAGKNCKRIPVRCSVRVRRRE